jgi:hypothetical protein
MPASFPALVTIVALALYIFTGIQVGRMRGLIGPRWWSISPLCCAVDAQ